MRKVSEEISARARQWENYLKDVQADPGAHARNYPQNVYRRVIIDLLLPEAGNMDVESQNRISGLDRLLSTFFDGGDFCWESDLEPGFPKEDFWYLFGSLRR